MTTDFFIMDAPDSDDYFPDVDNLLDDMEDTDPKSNASAPTAVPYVFVSFLLEVLQQFLVLVFALDMLIRLYFRYASCSTVCSRDDRF